MHTGDGHIVHQCLSGNAEAFALLVDKYKERIFALVYAKVGQFQDAEDITQDVFLNAYKKLSTLRRWDNFYPWLYSIAANRCKDFHCVQKRRVDTAHLADQDENQRADMAVHLENLRNEQLHEALASLPEMLSSSFSSTLHGWHEEQGDCPDVAGISQYHQSETQCAPEKN